MSELLPRIQKCRDWWESLDKAPSEKDWSRLSKSVDKWREIEGFPEKLEVLKALGKHDRLKWRWALTILNESLEATHD